MNKFFEEHPNIASALGVIIFFATIALLSVLAGCKPQQHIVEIVKTDTLHVYHTDTLKVVHNDTIFSVKVETKHDSIIIKEKEKVYLDAEGNVLHSEKEKEKESYHNDEKDTQLMQHTVDSLVQVWLDSVYQARYNEKPVVVEVEKPLPWYQKTWNRVIGKLAWIGLFFIGVTIASIIYQRIKKRIPK